MVKLTDFKTFSLKTLLVVQFKMNAYTLCFSKLFVIKKHFHSLFFKKRKEKVVHNSAFIQLTFPVPTTVCYKN